MVRRAVKMSSGGAPARIGRRVLPPISRMLHMVTIFTPAFIAPLAIVFALAVRELLARDRR